MAVLDVLHSKPTDPFSCPLWLAVSNVTWNYASAKTSCFLSPRGQSLALQRPYLTSDDGRNCPERWTCD